jgi:hypothetical protein
MERIAEKLNLFRHNQGVIRVPFLIKGTLVTPPDLSREQIQAAFKDVDQDISYLKLTQAQLIREPIIDRKTWKYTGEQIYQVLPPVNGEELIETDTGKLAQGLYALSVDDILNYLKSLSLTLNRNPKLLTELREISRLTSEYPDAFLDKWFSSLGSALDLKSARSMIDNELSLWGQPGSHFLNGWVKVSEKASIRAMPTRQLHITAGNTPDVPIISALRAILTKSAAVIKLPFGATLTGSMLAAAAAVAEPNHPLTRNLSVVYWQGGDTEIENCVFRPDAFDRVVVWGSPETVGAVQSRAIFTRTICLNPRYGISLIGREAWENNPEDVILKAVEDSLIYNQKACTASLVHYVEGNEVQANHYAELLSRILSQWDTSAPQFIPPSTRGQLKRLKRGKYSSARWYVNMREGEFTSGVMLTPDEFDIRDHPMCRLIVVRPVNDLKEVLQYLDQTVSTAGIYPEERRLALRDVILAKGVSNVFPLGQCDRIFAGMPHDGMPVLSQLVDWKNA